MIGMAAECSGRTGFTHGVTGHEEDIDREAREGAKTDAKEERIEPQRGHGRTPI